MATKKKKVKAKAKVKAKVKAKAKVQRKHGSKTESIRKLTKTGSYTYYVTIPKSIIDELGWREKQNLKVRRRGTSIVVDEI